MSADPAVTVDAPQTNESEVQLGSQLPALSSDDIAALDAKLGIPAKLRTDFPQEQPEPETEVVESTESETPESQAETATEEAPAQAEHETEEEETETEGEEDEEDEQPQGKQPDIAKLQKRNYKLRQRVR